MNDEVRMSNRDIPSAIRPAERLGAVSVPGSTRGWDGLMTWVTLSNGACPQFFTLEAGEYMRQLRRFSEGKVLPMS
jgi:hypothetical protein